MFRLSYAIAAFLGVLGMLLSSAAFAERRVALVVGNSDYRSVAKLPNTINDAQAIAGLLKKAEFEVVEQRQNLGVVEFKRALREFMMQADQADIAVVYYAGHGIEAAGNNYLIPIDARLASDYDAEDEAISLDRVIQALQPARRLRLVILDACRDNPFAPKMQRTVAVRAVASGLAKVEPMSTDTLIAYAAKAGSVSYDGIGSNSPFTAALLKFLAEPGVDIRIALGRVRDDVMKATQRKQEPFVYGSLGGATVALVAEPETKKAETPAWRDPNAVSRRDYELAERIGTKAAWESFLAAHETGLYADLARAQLAKLAAAASEAERRKAEREATAQTERQNTERRAALEAERKNAEQEAAREAERKKAEQEAAREAERKKAEQEAAREAERKKAAQEAAREAERKKAAQEAAQEAAREAERKKAEQEAAREAERKKAEHEAALEAERKKAAQQAALEAERKKAEREAALETERLARQRQDEERRKAEAAATKPDREAALKPTAKVDAAQQEPSCRRDAERLERLRADPAPDDVAKFAQEMSCASLRPQVLRLLESVAPGVTLPAPSAAAEPPAAERSEPAKSEAKPPPSEREATSQPRAVEPDPAKQEAACRRDQERLARLRTNPAPGEVARFARELSCEALRPQVQRLLESVGG